MNNEPLNKNEKQSAMGLKLKDYYEKRLAILRAKNDDAAPEITERLRGRIKEVKSVLNILNDEKKFTIESSDTI